MNHDGNELTLSVIQNIFQCRLPSRPYGSYTLWKEASEKNNTCAPNQIFTHGIYMEINRKFKIKRITRVFQKSSR